MKPINKIGKRLQLLGCQFEMKAFCECRIWRDHKMYHAWDIFNSLYNTSNATTVLYLRIHLYS
jgi:hypothetical protein